MASGVNVTIDGYSFHKRKATASGSENNRLFNETRCSSRRRLSADGVFGVTGILLQLFVETYNAWVCKHVFSRKVASDDQSVQSSHSGNGNFDMHAIIRGQSATRELFVVQDRCQ